MRRAKQIMRKLEISHPVYGVPRSSCCCCDWNWCPLPPKPLRPRNAPLCWYWPPWPRPPWYPVAWPLRWGRYTDAIEAAALRFSRASWLNPLDRCSVRKNFATLSSKVPCTTTAACSSWRSCTRADKVVRRSWSFDDSSECSGVWIIFNPVSAYFATLVIKLSSGWSDL